MNNRDFVYNAMWLGFMALILYHIAFIYNKPVGWVAFGFGLGLTFMEIHEGIRTWLNKKHPPEDESEL